MHYRGRLHRKCYSIFISQGVQYLFMKQCVCVKIQFNSIIGPLQNCSGQLIIFNRQNSFLKHTTLQKSCHYSLIFFNEKQNDHIKLIISSNIAHHIQIALSVRIITIRYFLKLCSPCLIHLKWFDRKNPQWKQNILTWQLEKEKWFNLHIWGEKLIVYILAMSSFVKIDLSLKICSSVDGVEKLHECLLV